MAMIQQFENIKISKMTKTTFEMFLNIANRYVSHPVRSVLSGMWRAARRALNDSRLRPVDDLLRDLRVGHLGSKAKHRHDFVPRMRHEIVARASNNTNDINKTRTS